MISYSVYKLLHLCGVFMAILAIGGAVAAALSVGDNSRSLKRVVAITHGIGLVLALVGGFGLLARIGVAHGSMPAWVMLKLGIWILFAGGLTMVRLVPKLSVPLWILTIILASVAAYLAGQKPIW